MEKLQRKVWFLVAVIFAACITIYTLSYMVTHPAHILPDNGGDCAKNNFTFLYHALYEHGYWFDGMNYPYGEHIVYTDGQPLLSVFLTFFKNVTPGEAFTLVFWLIGLSYILAIVFVYRILIHFTVPFLPAVIFAGCIVICCPQLLCLKGHYALGYTCVMPMLFYWAILYHRQFHWRYCIYIFVTGIIMAFIHPYYMAMILIFVTCYSIGYFIFTKEGLKEKIKHVWPLLCSAVSIFLLVAVIMKITDPVKDRPVCPFNDTGMYTQFTKIISSYYSPLWQSAIRMKIVPKASRDGEGFTYIGAVAIVTVIISFLFFVKNKLKKKQAGIINEPAVFSPVWLFIAFAVLLFSMGIPFIWHMEWLMDYFSAFRQFRALGRFSWVFYYIITIYATVVIANWYKGLIKKQKPFYGYLVLLSAISIWAYETSGYVRFSRELSRDAFNNYDLVYSNKEQDWEAFLQERHYSPNDFQAIILLPFFHIGTEKIWVGEPIGLIAPGTKGALQMRLPIMDVMLSRSSWSEAQKQVKMVAGPFSDKAILKDFKNRKPLLLFTISNKDSLAFDQDYLLDASDFIGDFSGGKVYACYPERLAANDKKYADSVYRILSYMKSPDTCIAGGKACYINHLDTGISGVNLFGSGAVPYIHHDSSLIATIPVNEKKDSVPYEFSCWFLLSKDDYKSPDVFLQFFNDGNQMIKQIAVSTIESVDSHNLWFRTSRYFYMPGSASYIKCMLQDAHGHSYKAMDEMLLRPADALVISRAADGSVMVNNHLFKTVKQ